MTVTVLHRTRPAWTYGDRLRKVRRDRHLTQIQLAELLHVTAKAVDAWECDRNKPRDVVGLSTRIEDQFGLPRGWMLGYADGLPEEQLPHLDSNQEPADLRTGTRPVTARHLFPANNNTHGGRWAA